MAFFAGAVVGALLAIILWPGGVFNHMIGEWAVLTFRLCPFYLLIFFMHSTAAVVIIAVVGNAILYGSLAIFCLIIYRSFKWLLRIARQ
jgi:hypothetical protein